MRNFCLFHTVKHKVNKTKAECSVSECFFILKTETGWKHYIEQSTVIVLVEKMCVIGHTREEVEGKAARNQSFGKLLPGIFVDLVSFLYSA